MQARRQCPRRFTNLAGILSAKRFDGEPRHALGFALTAAREADDFLGDDLRRGIGFVFDVEQFAGAVVRKLHEPQGLRVKGGT
jgi:hypothetical protein